ncbi:glycosyltransferase [Ornithinimicrobium cryptoxanthini]|uniref:glycosyltransferase n=1 Tax=Ornithinimicrobium cryptoxanthini TaxID=2934161 RepID=UPI0021187B4B|nr:glycosyltransferase [Ornithinimicrobium cryptoxanthini]
MSLTRNTAALGVGYLVRTPILLGYFVLATRTLGVDNYGVLAAIVALCTIAGPLAALGSTNLLIKHVARDPTTARTWLGSGLAASALGSLVLGMVVLLIAPVLLPPGTPVAALVLLLVGELVLARTVELGSAIFVATERMHLTTVNQVGFPLTRLATVGVLVVGPWSVTLTTWALAAALGAAAWAVVAVTLATRAVGAPRWSLAPVRREWRQGMLFASGVGLHNVHQDADKIVLARLAGPEAAGVYAAAYRLLDAAYTPVRALLGAAYPRMFRHGADGSGALAPLLRRVGRPAVGYAVVAALVALVLSPLAPPVLGAGFAQVQPVLAALAALLVLRTLAALPADALTGAGYQGRRTLAQLAVTVLNVAALLVLIPRWGIWGAVWGTLAAEALLAIVLWTVWARVRRAAPAVADIDSAPAAPAARAEALAHRPPVVLVTGVLRPRRGMEVALLELARDLSADRRVEIVLVHGPDPGDAPVPVTALPPHGRLRRTRALRRLLAERPDADIVLCGLWASAHVMVTAPSVLRQAVGWEHSITAARMRDAGPRTRLRIGLAGRAYRRCRAVVAVSDEVAIALRHHWQVEAAIVPNLLPALTLIRAGAAGNPAPATQGAAPDVPPAPVPHLLTVGALVPPKNHALVLQALALLSGQWSLTVAGDGPLRARLGLLADSLGIADRVTWLGHVDSVPDLMASADLLLAPSLSETFGYTLLEAGSAHLPVVGLDVPVVREVVPAVAPGLLVTEPEPAALAAAVRAALSPRASWDFAGADARRQARFGREEVLTTWRQVLG